MRFETIRYMEWAKTHSSDSGEKTLDLASSDMPKPVSSLEELGIDLSGAPLSGDNRYGYSKLREGIASRYGVQPCNILTSQGSSMANFLLLAVLTDPGDVILVESPVYECLAAPARSLGLKVLNLLRHKDNGWRLDIEEAVKLTRQNGARGIFITNPHNPSGVFCPDDEIGRLAKGVGDDVFILIDEIYREWLPEQRGRTSALSSPNIFATSSLTKVWGFGHLRCGWAIAPENLVTRAYRAYDHLGVVHPFLMDWISGELFSMKDLLDMIRDRNIESLAASRKVVDQFLEIGTEKSIKTVMPDAGGIALWEINGLTGDEAGHRLRKEAGIQVVPGSFFGEPDCVRVSWTQGERTVIEALNNMQKWLISL